MLQHLGAKDDIKSPGQRMENVMTVEFVTWESFTGRCHSFLGEISAGARCGFVDVANFLKQVTNAAADINYRPSIQLQTVLLALGNDLLKESHSIAYVVGFQGCAITIELLIYLP